MTNQAAQTMPFQPEILRAIARSTSDTAKTNALLNAACEIERLTAALAQTAGVVDGWKLVPVEPTEVMCEAAMSSLGWTRSEAAAKTAPITPASPMMEGSMKVWSAMLAAAPAARVDDRVQRLIDEARRCAGSTGDLSDLRAALMPFEGDY